MTQNQLVEILQTGHTSTVDADKLDGKHASELIVYSISDPPEGHEVTKIEFTWNPDGTVETIKYLEDSTELFTLTFAWNPNGTVQSITRSEPS